MSIRSSGKEQREEGRAKCDDPCHIFQIGVAIRPPQTIDLSTIRHLIADRVTGGDPEIEFYDEVRDNIRPELRSAILVIVCELLLNACRHSKSANVLVGLAEDNGDLCLQVEDWGIGFDPQDTELRKGGLSTIHGLVGWLGARYGLSASAGKGRELSLRCRCLAALKRTARSPVVSGDNVTPA